MLIQDSVCCCCGIKCKSVELDPFIFSWTEQQGNLEFRSGLQTHMQTPHERKLVWGLGYHNVCLFEYNLIIIIALVDVNNFFSNLEVFEF